jgi:LPPG:FO 2-phospho-L-lactate transferase
MNATQPPSSRAPKLLALCGGIGGAKLALGLERLYGGAVTVVVNTGDDFEHLGLHVSPDIDTVLYTLGGRSDLERGWGRAGETWQFMKALHELGGETWFQLGDSDLAMHVERTRQLRAGVSLTGFTRDIARKFGIAATILPMSDDRVETTVITADAAMPFQRYFVEKQCAPVVKRIEFRGAERAKASDAVIAAVQDPGLDAIIICPSNPYLSIDPILSVGNLRSALKEAAVPVIVVSPLIGGAAVKGPTAKIMAELGVPANSRALVTHYAELIDGIVIDESDSADADLLDVPVCVTPTLMRNLEDRIRLARTCAEFAVQLKAQTLQSAGGVR